MHHAANQFIQHVQDKYPHLFLDVNVLDVGSLDINGNNRHWFYGNKCRYTGIDIGAGKNVDVVYDGKKMPFEDTSFDVVISTECMEHNEHLFATLQEMSRVLRSGGLMLITCAGYGRPEHGTDEHDPVASPFTHNFYNNVLAVELCGGLSPESDFFPFVIEYAGAYDLYFYGIKK